MALNAVLSALGAFFGRRATMVAPGRVSSLETVCAPDFPPVWIVPGDPVDDLLRWELAAEPLPVARGGGDVRPGPGGAAPLAQFPSTCPELC